MCVLLGSDGDLIIAIGLALLGTTVTHSVASSFFLVRKNLCSTGIANLVPLAPASVFNSPFNCEICSKISEGYFPLMASRDKVSRVAVRERNPVSQVYICKRK